MTDTRIKREWPLEVLDIRRSGEGRTVLARAVRYNGQDVVTDDGRVTYIETWLPGVFARSIELRPDRIQKIPVMGMHDTHKYPFGAVERWIDTDDSLDFEAKISRTTAGDEILELINDGAVGGISVGAQPIENRQIPGGIARVEAKLLEVSICTFPQLADATILAVRAQPEPPPEAPRLDAARAFLASIGT